jgi:hypothetical protein
VSIFFPRLDAVRNAQDITMNTPSIIRRWHITNNANQRNTNNAMEAENERNLGMAPLVRVETCMGRGLWAVVLAGDGVAQERRLFLALQTALNFS